MAAALLTDMTRTALPVLALLASSALAGCAYDLEEEFATAVVQSSLETPSRQTAGREIADGLGEDCLFDAADAVEEAAARPTVGLYPSSCLTKTADDNRLHAEFSGCTGAFGKVELDGGVDAVVTVTDSCRLHAEVEDSGDLTANGEAFDYAASAEIEVTEGARALSWSAHWSGTTARGRDIEQTSDLDVRVDPTSCLGVDGEIDGHVDEFDYGASLSGLRVCPGVCPEAGTVEAHWKRFRRERSIRVQFDGSNLAHVWGWTGRELDVEMTCEPASAQQE